MQDAAKAFDITKIPKFSKSMSRGGRPGMRAASGSGKEKSDTSDKKPAEPSTKKVGLGTWDVGLAA